MTAYKFHQCIHLKANSLSTRALLTKSQIVQQSPLETERLRSRSKVTNCCAFGMSILDRARKRTTSIKKEPLIFPTKCFRTRCSNISNSSSLQTSNYPTIFTRINTSIFSNCNSNNSSKLRIWYYTSQAPKRAFQDSSRPKLFRKSKETKPRASQLKAILILAKSTSESKSKRKSHLKQRLGFSTNISKGSSRRKCHSTSGLRNKSRVRQSLRLSPRATILTQSKLSVLFLMIINRETKVIYKHQAI